TYLPLHTTHPTPRLHHLLHTTNTTLIITDKANEARAREFGLPVVVVDDDATYEGMPSDNLETVVQRDSLAYVMFTSGSTGQPKGVAITHGDVLSLAADRRWRDAGHTTLFHSPHAFDASTFEIWAPLLTGGTVAVAPEEVNPGSLGRMVDQLGATIVFLTTALFNVLAEEAPDCFSGLKEVWTGGEAASPAAFLRVLERCPDTRVVHVYGPTETTTFAVCHPMTRELAAAGSAPIGGPLDDTGLYVLGERLELVPPGAPGELYIAGTGLGRGYLGRADLTSERFVANPFGDGDRLYRTGDLVRWNLAGAVEFLGRTDEQVKIRGFRIELAEIEAVLLTHEDVAEAIVVAARDESGRKCLAAYVVPVSGSEVDTAGLVAFAGRSLPEYMLPAAVVALPVLPLNDNGKVDRRLLPDPVFEKASSTRTAPRNPTERALAEIFIDVLGLAEIGVDDNFFALGGDSILAIQLVAKAQRAGLKLTSKDVFRSQTIAALSPLVIEGEVAPREDGPVTGPVPLTPIQRFLFDRFTAPGVFNQYAMGELSREVDENALREAVNALLAHHDALRMRFAFVDGQWAQRNAPVEWADALTVVDVLAEDEANAVEAAQTAVDFERGPLLQAVLLTGPERSKLLLTVHHLVVDGVSWRVLVEDLETAYRQARQGVPVDLGRKSTSFRDWAIRLVEHAGNGGFDDELSHWSSIGAEPELPVDRRGANTVASTRTVTVGLDAELSGALLRDVPGVYRTEVNDVLVAALARVLSRWAGRDDVLLGMEGHGREELFDDIDLGRTVGWFTSYFPVAVRVPAGDWGGALKSVKEQLRSVPRRGIGYGALRYASGGTALTGDAHPKVGLNYLGQFEHGGAGGGLYRSAPEIDLHQDPADVRMHELEIVGSVLAGEFTFSWSYSDNLHDEATIRALAAEFTTALAQIVAHCAEPGSGGRTPSDFPLAGLDQAAVDRIASSDAVQEIYPLTAMQSGMLFHALLDRGRTAYLEQAWITANGVDDPEALGEAMRRVVARTPVLRTVVAWEGLPHPVQVVRDDVEVPVTLLDWRELDEDERRAALDRHLAAERDAGMDLAVAPLVRIAAARVSATRVRLMWTFHHLLLDGWSLMLVLSELFGEYAALTGGGQFVPERRRSYQDYVRWLRDQDVESAERYWRAALAAVEAPTALPRDRNGVGSHRAFSSAERAIRFTPEVTERLYAMARDARVTVNTVLQGVWALALARYSGERTVCFGATTAGRPAGLTGADAMVGLFINTLPVCVDVDPADGLVPWLQRLQNEQVAARQHEHVALAQVKAWSGLERGVELFESVVVFENYPVDAELAAERGLVLAEIGKTTGTNYPLNVVVYPGEPLLIELYYDPEAFDVATVDRMAGHLRTIVEAVAAEPGRRVEEISMLPAAERATLLGDWAGTESPGRVGRRLHEVIADRARQCPDEVAVAGDGEQVSYGELDRRANQLAHHLIELGVGREVPVGIAMERCPDLVVAILGVLKAGGGYVPLDPAYPQERLNAMLAETRPPVVVTQEHLVPRLPAGQAELLCLDRERSLVAKYPEEPPEIDGTPGDLAYIVYTSGSTGRPKGVMVEHRSLHNLVLAACDAYGLRRGSRVLQVYSMSFDGGVQDVFMTLAAGATLVLADSDRRHDVPYLDALLRDEAITVAVLPQAVLSALDTGTLPSLVCAGTGGDVLPTELADTWSRGGRTMINIYGPSETTIAVTLFPVVHGGGYRAVPIGRPLPNNRFHVLDARMRPVPVGVTGELYIGGAGVSRGYVGQPGLTAERFVADPFSPHGARLYRSGDLMRWNASGMLEFAGRADHQVKIRGFRVELGEVENVLTRHERVAESAATVRTGPAGDRNLVGYVVPVDGAALSTAELRAHAEAWLPEYMVPSAFVTMPSLPLSPNGKIDRKALPEPGREHRTEVEYVAPREPTEQALADVWVEVLGVGTVGVFDDFFALGGDSITSIRLTSRMREAFGVAISPRDIFDAPTVAGLAETVQDLILAKWENAVEEGAGGRG
ncbi:amino acid adenylation domain-containing protein, partial [Amycolatopsis minnesotensis]|uniref:amino acid adenylation domain-containing protein n=1 Tax=Amycolatopsis minnesotensis TaxID=337894 RepID=UPI0031DEA32F